MDVQKTKSTFVIVGSKYLFSFLFINQQQIVSNFPFFKIPFFERPANRGQQDRYVSTTVSIPDAKVAAVLCHGGPIHYHLKEDSGLSNSWVCEHIVPNITRVYGTTVGAVLGRAVLWRAMDPEDSLVLPKEWRDDIQRLYNEHGGSTLDDGENPVAKIPLLVHGDNGKLIITPLLDDWGEDDENMTEEERRTRRRQRYEGDMNIRRARSHQSNNQAIQALTSHSISLQNELVAFQQDTNRKFDLMMKQLNKVNRNLASLLKQPFRVVGSSGSSNRGRQ